MHTLILSVENEKDLGKWQEGSSPDFTNHVCVSVCVCVCVWERERKFSSLYLDSITE